MNTLKIGGVQLGADESEVTISLAVVQARLGEIEKARQTLDLLMDDDSVVIEPRQVVLARAYAEICRALPKGGDSDRFLKQLEQLAAESGHVASQASCMVQLARVHVFAGDVDKCRQTIQRLHQLEGVSAVNEALAEIAVEQLQAGLPQEAQTTLEKITPPSLWADEVRFKLAVSQAQSLNFRDATLTASDIQSEFLQTRSLYAILAFQLECGTVFEESARKLVALADDMRRGFRNDDALRRQLLCDSAVAATKWDLTVENRSNEPQPDLIQNTIQLGRVARAANAAMDVFEALESDLALGQKASIRISRGMTAARIGSMDLAEEQFGLALEDAKSETESAARSECLEQVGLAYAESGLNEVASGLAAKQEDTQVKAALLLGLAKGTISDEEITKAAEEGIVVQGARWMSHRSHQPHRFWQDFAAGVPGELNPTGKPNHVRLEGELLLLAVPTPQGLMIAIPPSLAGLKAWVAITAKSSFSREETAGFAAFIEGTLPLGSEKIIGRFKIRKQRGTRPSGWLVFTLEVVEDGSPVVSPDVLNGEPTATWSKMPVDAKAGEVRTISGIKFCWCPPGNFTMGSTESEIDRLLYENQVPVTISRGFYLGQCEVTQAEWEKLMGTSIEQQRDKQDTTNSLYGTGNTYPMYYVSWDEAMEFCQKLTAQEREAGRLPSDWEYTLPTEAQWEYACRAGTKTATAFGDKLDSTQANFDGNYPYNGADKGNSKEQTTAVGSYQTNAWNLYDMHGNVWEWCRDWYVDQLPGGADPVVLEQATLRVRRGGSWVDLGGLCRSAFRSRNAPGFRNPFLGFRLALVQSR